jgi:predicted DNA-binding transcriptional regulator YafY
VNLKGVWYLAARHDDKLKTFSFGRIDALMTTDETFEPDAQMLERIRTEEGVWLSERTLEVVITVDAQAAPYFKRRRLIANQVIVKELADGGLIVSARVGHANQVLPIVRYWMPHLRIVSPVEMQAELEDGVRGYLGKGGVAT